MNEYNFPITEIYEAMEVTSPNFPITEVEGWETKLYVEGTFNTFENCFGDYSFLLGINENKHNFKPRKFQKSIFYGHKGTGKSTLLVKFKEYLDKNTEYITVFINLVDFFEVAEMQKEDVYVAIVSAFLQKMDKEQVPVQEEIFKDIIKEWVKGEEYQQEIEKQWQFEPSATLKLETPNTGLSFLDKFLNFLKLEANVKGLYSSKNVINETIRRSISQNSKTLIDRLNQAFATLRTSYFKGKQDLIFVIDGLEKARPNVYKELFIDDIALINRFNAHAVYCVPIRTFYDLSNRHTREDLEAIYLPLYRNTQESKSFFFSGS
jgi:GTPase SAR1 family protein